MTAWKSFGTIECLFITYNLWLLTYLDQKVCIYQV